MNEKLKEYIPNCKGLDLTGKLKSKVGLSIFKILVIGYLYAPLPSYCDNKTTPTKKKCEDEMGEIKVSLDQLPGIINKILNGKDFFDEVQELYIRFFHDKEFTKVVTLNKAESLVFSTYFPKLISDYKKLVARDGKHSVDECVEIFKKTIPAGEFKDSSIDELAEKIKDIFDKGEIHFTFSVKKK